MFSAASHPGWTRCCARCRNSSSTSSPSATRRRARSSNTRFPENVCGFDNVVLDGRVFEPRAWRSRAEAQQTVYDCYQAVLSGQGPTQLRPLLLEIDRKKLGSKILLDSRQAWLAMEEHYSSLVAMAPLLDFFWAWRVLLRSLINIAVAPLPPARLYHATSTGYAGLFGAREVRGAAAVPAHRAWHLHQRAPHRDLLRRLDLRIRDLRLQRRRPPHRTARHLAQHVPGVFDDRLRFRRRITAQYRANQRSQIQDDAPPTSFG